jgi:murein DD-endopeptidase MepM/ murein hydrolase activator NlpD
MILYCLRSLGCIIAIFSCLAIAGCATTRHPPVSVESTTDKKPSEKKGVYHKVSKGETLWRIAKTYKVSTDDIIQANGIPNAASIEDNQLIFIPGAVAVKVIELPQGANGVFSDYLWPLKGRIVSFFDDRKGAHVNHGIDVEGMEGEIVKSSRDGNVSFADNLPGYGYTIILDHADGFFTVYGHMERPLIKLGDHVFRGEKIAQVARDGARPFLHFEIRKGDISKNPLHYLPQEM